MKLHHFLTILCVVFFIGFVTMTAIYFDLGKDVLALEKEIETITAERDQLAEEIEHLNADLEDHKTDINNLVTSFNKLHDKVINDALDEVQARLVCAHELGHYFLHRGMNRMFMNRATLAVTGKYEKEAHRFAVDLLYSDDDLLPYLSRPIADAAAFMGVPSSIAEYRLSTIRVC